MSHHPLCITLWSGEAAHCTCPETNTCETCPGTCEDCTWDNSTCECNGRCNYYDEDEEPTP